MQPHPKSGLRRLMDAYEVCSFAQLLKVIQPLGILVAVVTLFATFYEIRENRQEINQNRELREAMLFSMAMERTAVARELDLGKKAVTKDEDGNWRCSSRFKRQSARVGQIPVLERMAGLGISLEDIELNDLNLIVGRSRREQSEELLGIDLGNANLRRADFHNTNLTNALLSNANLISAQLKRSCLKEVVLSGADLRDANLSESDMYRADLSNAILINTDLYRTDLSRAKLIGAKFDNADISGVDFSRAVGLTQEQLDSACAAPDEPPKDLPKSKGKKLVWTPSECT